MYRYVIDVAYVSLHTVYAVRNNIVPGEIWYGSMRFEFNISNKYVLGSVKMKS